MIFSAAKRSQVDGKSPGCAMPPAVSSLGKLLSCNTSGATDDSDGVYLVPVGGGYVGRVRRSGSRSGTAL